jgi:hypothetical protein
MYAEFMASSTEWVGKRESNGSASAGTGERRTDIGGAGARRTDIRGVAPCTIDFQRDKTLGLTGPYYFVIFRGKTPKYYEHTLFPAM